MENQRFKLGYELTDYGKLLFEYDESLGATGMSAQKRKAMLKNPGFYYFMAIIVVLVTWFIASLISNSIKHGFLVSIGMHVSGAFALFVMTFIIVASFGGFWGKLIQKSAGKKNSNNSNKEFVYLSENKKNALQIFEDWIVVTNLGVVEVLDVHMIAMVRLSLVSSAFKRGYNVAFCATNGEIKFAKVRIPAEKYLIIQLKKIFGDAISVERPVKKAVLRPTKALSEIIVPTLFVSIAIFAGAGVIAMHFLVERSIPIFLGAFFIIGGVLGICGILDFIPILKDVVVPLLFGAIFLFFPYMVIDTIYKANDKALEMKSFLAVFNPIGAAVIFFGGLGLLFVIIAIKTVIDYIRYREKK